MTPEERAAGRCTADLGEWPDVLPEDDRGDLVSSDLAAAAMGVLYVTLIAAAMLGVAVALL